MGNKKSKKNVYLVFVVLIALVFGGIFFFGRQTGLGGCGSSTILSIDKAVLTTSSDLDGKEVVRVTAVVNGGGECANIIWDKNQLKNALERDGNSYSVDNSVYGDFTKKYQEQVFTLFSNSNQPYERAELTKVSGSIGNLCLEPNLCENNGIQNSLGRVHRGNLFSGDCYCVQTKVVGENADFSSSFEENFEIEFGIQGLQSGIINSKDQRSLFLKDSSGKKKAHVKWTGYMLNNKWNSIPNYDGIYIYGNNVWHLTRDGAYNEYLNLIRDFRSPSTWDSVAVWDYPDAESRVLSYNAQLENIISNKESEYLSRTPFISSLEQEGAELRAQLEHDLVFPVFTIDIVADVVGIHKVEGTPELDCSGLGDFTTQSGKTKTQSFTIKNDAQSGSQKAGFSLGVDCTNGGSALLETYNVNLGGQQSTRVDVTSSLLVQSGTKESQCTITARDINSENSDTCGYDFKAESIEVDECSSDICFGSQLWECVNGKYNQINCKYGCSMSGGQPICVSPETEICNDGIDNDNDGKIDMKDEDCQEDCNFFCTLKKNAFMISIATSILLGLMFFGVLYNTYEAKKKKKDTLNLLLFLAGSIGLGVAVFYIFKLFIDFLFSWQGMLVVIVAGVILSIVFAQLRRFKVI